MKKITLSICLLTVFGGLAGSANGDTRISLRAEQIDSCNSRGESEVGFDFFYQSLNSMGEWFSTPEFGYVWRPRVAIADAGWRPYTDGYWAETDQGWTWVSYENFGWASYHYGRWTQLETVGWVWVPGYEWGPGWVSWRTSGEYIGWAPIPPRRHRRARSTVVEFRAGEPVYDVPSSAISGPAYADDDDNCDEGYSAAIEGEYDIGPSQYCFTPVRTFGASSLARVVVPARENVTIIRNTVNVTNIAYKNVDNRRVIYNGGPDRHFVRTHCDRPIPRLRLARQTDVTRIRSQINIGQVNVVQGDQLNVVAPRISRRGADFDRARPPRINERLTRLQAAPVADWKNVAMDSKPADLPVAAAHPGYRRRPMMPLQARMRSEMRRQRQTPSPSEPPMQQAHRMEPMQVQSQPMMNSQQVQTQPAPAPALASAPAHQQGGAMHPIFAQRHNGPNRRQVARELQPKQDQGKGERDGAAEAR